MYRYMPVCVDVHISIYIKYNYVLSYKAFVILFIFSYMSICVRNNCPDDVWLYHKNEGLFFPKSTMIVRKTGKVCQEYQANTEQAKGQ